MRSRIKRLEGDAEGLYYVSIPQNDGTVKRFSQSAFLEAWSTSVKRLCGEDVPEHPMSAAFRNSLDPNFHNCLIARQSREEEVS